MRGVGEAVVEGIERLSSEKAPRATTDPSAARLLEMFTKADEILSEHSLERIVRQPARSEIPRFGSSNVGSVLAAQGTGLGTVSLRITVR